MKQPRRQRSSIAKESRQVSAGNAGQGKRLRLQFCFFVSGAAGLMYQVVWGKQLSQLFGYSAYAVAAVLAAFMGGLALGSALFARWRPGNHRGIGLYAWMEFGIALTALCSLPGMTLVRSIYLAGCPYLSGSTTLLVALRFLGAALVLALPTVLMGGTLPVLLSGVARDGKELGVRAGRFYAVNTAGAVAGTLTAGFILLPWIGLRLTLFGAVALNVIAGALARTCAKPEEAADEGAAERRPASVAKPPSPLYLACFAAVGATAIAYEIGWTRLLATPLGSSTYAFSLMLGTFLFGIAVGSAVFEKWFRRRRTATAQLFAWTQLAIASVVLLSLIYYREIPELLLRLLRSLGENFSGLLVAQAAACALAMLPATVLFGFNFPAVLALIGGNENGGEWSLRGCVGRAYAANTGGAIAAAILCGFLLLPWMGSFRLIAGAACVNVLIGSVLFCAVNGGKVKPLSVAALLLATILWTAASPAFYSKTVAAFGVVLYRGFHSPGLTAQEMADTEDVLFFKDGINSTIAVTRSENYIALKTNGKVDASNLDSGTQLMLGDLGAVFHPNPRRVLIIGFGGGMTASAVARFPEVERIDCVEIEPAVLQAAAKLERLHRGVIGDKRLHVYFDDARNFLQTSRARYDLIISEPSNPWIAGVASLFSKEFFRVVRQHLAPGGNFVQWIQAYGLSAGDFSMILASLAPPFADVTLWHSPGKDFVVLARADSASPLSLERSRTLWSNQLLQQDFRQLGLQQPDGWPAYLRLGNRELKKLILRSELITDDLNRLEYAAPRHILKVSLTAELRKNVAAYAGDDVVSAEFPNEDVAKMAEASAETALEVDPQGAANFLKLIPENRETPEVSVLRARAELQDGKIAAAAKELEKLAADATSDNRLAALYWLAVARRDQGQLAQANSFLEQLLASQPNNLQALAAKVDVASRQQDWAAAVVAQTKLASLKSDSAADQCKEGDLFLRSREIRTAEAPLKRGLQLDPYMFLCHRDLGELYRATGRTGEAVKELEWVVRYFPEADNKTYISLALAFQVIGEKQKANASVQKGRRIFPQDSLLREFAMRE